MQNENGYRLFKATYKDRRGNTQEAAKWYVELSDHLEHTRRLPAFTSKTASDEMGKNLVRLVEYHKATGGQTDPAIQTWLAGLPQRTRERLSHIGLLAGERVAANKTLEEHLGDFHRAVLEKGSTPKHANLIRARIQRAAKACGFRFIADVRADRFQTYLADLQRSKAQAPLDLTKPEFTKAEVAAALGIKPSAVTPLVARHGLPATGKGPARRFPRETVEFLRQRLAAGASLQTANFYLAAFRAFFRWLVRNRRATENPLAHVEGFNVKLDRRHDRQTLGPDQLANILATAGKSDRTFRGLAGSDRRMVYLLAMSTGFRAAELASIRRNSFDLNPAAPTVFLSAEDAKNRKSVQQPLPADVAEELRGYLARKPDGDLLWPGSWAEKAADMLRRDLAEAGLRYVVDGPDGPLHADFHALRHSFVALLDRSGATMKQAMQLARHSDPKLTAARYGRARLHDLSDVVNRMPPLIGKPPVSEREALPATGTDGAARRATESPNRGDSVLAECLALSDGSDGAQRDLMERKCENSESETLAFSPRETAVPVGETALRPAGFEPATYGLGNRRNVAATHDEQDTYGERRNVLADCLALFREKNPDLALLVERWDALPEAIRSGIMALIRADYSQARVKEVRPANDG